MRKIILYLSCSLLFAGGLTAQQDTTKGAHKGIMSVSLTIPAGYLLKQKSSIVYLDGSLEYYTDSKISIRGEGIVLISGAGSADFLKQNNILNVGAFYHFPTHSNFDPIFGFQPGIALTQATQQDNTLTINPVASVVTGFNFFAEKWFHILVNVRYSLERNVDAYSLSNLNEISFSFGLGWNLDVVK